MSNNDHDDDDYNLCFDLRDKRTDRQTNGQEIHE